MTLPSPPHKHTPGDCSDCRGLGAGLRRAALVVEAYAGKALGGLAHLLTTPLRLLPFWPKRKRLTDSYLRDPHVVGYELGSAGGTPTEDAVA